MIASAHSYVHSIFTDVYATQLLEMKPTKRKVHSAFLQCVFTTWKNPACPNVRRLPFSTMTLWMVFQDSRVNSPFCFHKGTLRTLFTEGEKAYGSWDALLLKLERASSNFKADYFKSAYVLLSSNILAFRWKITLKEIKQTIKKLKARGEMWRDGWILQTEQVTLQSILWW